MCLLIILIIDAIVFYRLVTRKSADLTASSLAYTGINAFLLVVGSLVILAVLYAMGICRLSDVF